MGTLFNASSKGEVTRHNDMKKFHLLSTPLDESAGKKKFLASEKIAVLSRP